MNVLYVCSGRSFKSLNPNRKLSEVVQCWRNANFEVKHVCGGDLDTPTPDSGEYGSSTIHRKWYRNLRILQPYIHSASEYRDVKHNKKLSEYIVKISKKENPDIVWERSSRLHCSGLPLARMLGVPYVLEWKDNLIPYQLSWFRKKALALEKKKNNEADYIVVESNVLKLGLSREGVDPQKIIVAHNAVDAEQFSRNSKSRVEVRRDLCVEDDEILVGYLGSYAFYHDAVRLVLAADVLLKKGAKKIKILMVGAGKEYPEAHQLALQKELLCGNLIMKPGVPQDQVPGILSALDIAVLPGSTDIICPIKVQEYMAAELATVAPDYACNREVIDDGETGVLFNPKDEKDLAAKIIMLAEDQERRVTMGHQAREEVIRRFSWDATWGAALECVLEQTKANDIGRKG